MIHARELREAGAIADQRTALRAENRHVTALVVTLRTLAQRVLDDRPTAKAQAELVLEQLQAELRC